jgi:hypothetical protein
MEVLHRMLSGNTASRRQLIGAGVFVLVWFLIDVVQFVHGEVVPFIEWVAGRF